MLGLGLRLGLEAVGWDLVHLPRGGHVHHVVGLDFDFVAGRQEGVETHDQIWVAFEELGDTADHPRSVDAAQGGKERGQRPATNSDVGRDEPYSDESLMATSPLDSIVRHGGK